MKWLVYCDTLYYPFAEGVEADDARSAVEAVAKRSIASLEDTWFAVPFEAAEWFGEEPDRVLRGEPEPWETSA